MGRSERKEAQIIDLEAQRVKRREQRTSEEYSGYLNTLGISQLEKEAHHLLEEFSGQNFGPDYTQRVHLLLGELAGRADEPFRQAIQRLHPPMDTK